MTSPTSARTSLSVIIFALVTGASACEVVDSGSGKRTAGTADSSAPPAVPGLGTLEQTFVAISQDVADGAATPAEAAERWFAEAENALK